MSVDLINKKLIEEYGRGITIYSKLSGLGTNVTKDLSSNDPTFRVIWSTSQMETRYGEFNEFTQGGDIFLRTVNEVRTQPKYEEEIYKDKWILEQLLVSDGNPYLVKAGVQYSYEPRWVFGNVNSDPQPIWKAVKLLCDQCLTIGRVIKSPKQLEDDEREAILKERMLSKDILKNESPFMSSGATLHNANGVKSDGIIVPSNYERQK